jgi:hypothetical protein
MERAVFWIYYLSAKSRKKGGGPSITENYNLWYFHEPIDILDIYLTCSNETRKGKERKKKISIVDSQREEGGGI